MPLRFKVESNWLLSFFYAVSGIAFIATLTVNLGLIHCGILGILGFVASYGVFKMRRWSAWFVVFFFFLGNTFVFTNLFIAHMSIGLIPLLIHLLFLLATWLATLLFIARRKTLQ